MVKTREMRWRKHTSDPPVGGVILAKSTLEAELVAGLIDSAHSVRLGNAPRLPIVTANCEAVAYIPPAHCLAA